MSNHARSTSDAASSKRKRLAAPLRHPTPSLGRVLEFMRLLWALDHALQTTSKRMTSSLGITGPQRLVLRIVGRFPGISAGHLAKVLHVDPSTLTGVLGRLEQAGMIRRHPDQQDRRRALFRLTPRGRRFDVAAKGTVESAVRTALDRVSPSELEVAKSVLRTLTDALERAGRAR